MLSEKQIEANRRNAQKSTGPTSPEGKKRTALNAARHYLTGQINVCAPEDREAYHEFCQEFVESLMPETFIERQFAQSAAEDMWRLSRARAIENNIFAEAAAKPEDFAAPEAPASEATSPEAATNDGGDLDEAAKPVLTGYAPANSDVDSALAASRLFVADPQRFQLLTTYEQRIHRSLRKSMDQLQQLQARRQAEAAQRREAASKLSQDRHFARKDALLIRQFHTTKGLPYDAAKDRSDPNGFVFSNDELDTSIHREKILREAQYLHSIGWNLKNSAGRAA